MCAACKLIRAQIEDNIGASRRIVKYNEEEWERTYISPNDNGLVATQWERIAESEASNSERQKFVKEMRMCKVLADNGHDVEYLQGVNRPAGQTYDIRMDSIKADLKCITGGASNIVKYAKKALTKQGGEAVILEIPSHTPEYYAALAEARRKCNGRIFFYFSDDMELKEIKNEVSDNRPRGGTRSLTLSLHIRCALQRYKHVFKSKQYEQNYFISEREQPLQAPYRGTACGVICPDSLGSYILGCSSCFLP